MGIEKVGNGGRVPPVPPVERPQRENKGGKGGKGENEGKDSYEGTKKKEDPGTYDRRGRR